MVTPVSQKQTQGLPPHLENPAEQPVLEEKVYQAAADAMNQEEPVPAAENSQESPGITPLAEKSKEEGLDTQQIPSVSFAQRLVELDHKFTSSTKFYAGQGSAGVIGAGGALYTMSAIRSFSDPNVSLVNALFHTVFGGCLVTGGIYLHDTVQSLYGRPDYTNPTDLAAFRYEGNALEFGGLSIQSTGVSLGGYFHTLEDVLKHQLIEPQALAKAYQLEGYNSSFKSMIALYKKLQDALEIVKQEDPDCRYNFPHPSTYKSIFLSELETRRVGYILTTYTNEEMQEYACLSNGAIDTLHKVNRIVFDINQVEQDYKFTIAWPLAVSDELQGKTLETRNREALTARDSKIRSLEQENDRLTDLFEIQSGFIAFGGLSTLRDSQLREIRQRFIETRNKEA